MEMEMGASERRVMMMMKKESEGSHVATLILDAQYLLLPGLLLKVKVSRP
jgi:hypothetical protein